MFTKTRLKGAFITELEWREDERGFFLHAAFARESLKNMACPVIAPSGIAMNRKKGTVRGMHFQFPPAADTKLDLDVRRRS